MYPEAIAHLPKSMQVFVKKIGNRVNKGKNAIIIVVGATGSGKSISTLHLMLACYLYIHGKYPDPYRTESHCVFKAKNFLEEMNNPDLEPMGEWMWDEAGVGMGHKEQMSVQNRVIGWLAQTFRNLRQITFITVPSMSFIDASVRRLLHYYVETMTIDREKKICYLKPLRLQYNNRMNKIYYHSFITMGRGDNAGVKKIKMMAVPLPPEEYIKLYEAKKNIFTRDLNVQIQKILQRVDAKGGGDMAINKLTEKQLQIYRLLDGDKFMQVQELALKVKRTTKAVYDAIRKFKAEGIDISRWVEKNRKAVDEHQKNSIRRVLGKKDKIARSKKAFPKIVSKNEKEVEHRE